MAKQYSSIVDMMRELTEDSSFAEGLAEHLAQRQLITDLIAMRVARGMTQQELARKLECTQGRVSKIESSTHGDLDLKTLVRYADAVGYNVEITLAPKRMTLVDRVKQHAFAIKRLTDRLAKLGATDPKIADGVGEFLKEAAFNLVQLVRSSAKHLPSASEEPSQPLAINVVGAEDDEDECSNKPAKPSKRTKRKPVKG